MIWGENAPSKWSILPSKWDVFENHGKSPLNKWDDLGGKSTISRKHPYNLPESWSQRVCPWKSYRNRPKKGYRLPVPSFFRGELLNFGGRVVVYKRHPRKGLNIMVLQLQINPSCVILSLHQWFWCKTMVMSLLYTLVLSLSNILRTWLSFTNTSQLRLRRVANMMPASQNPAGFTCQVDTPADIPYA